MMEHGDDTPQGPPRQGDDTHARWVKARGKCPACGRTAVEPSCGTMTQAELEAACESYLFNVKFGYLALLWKTRQLLEHRCEEPGCDVVSEVVFQTFAREWYACREHGKSVARSGVEADGRVESLFERRQRLGMATRGELKQMQREHYCLWCGGPGEAMEATRVAHGFVYHCAAHRPQVRARAEAQLAEHKKEQGEIKEKLAIYRRRGR
jgi:hypothetical protein